MRRQLDGLADTLNFYCEIKEESPYKPDASGFCSDSTFDLAFARKQNEVFSSHRHQRYETIRSDHAKIRSIVFQFRVVTRAPVRRSTISPGLPGRP